MVSDYVLITGVGVVCITYVEIFPDGIFQPIIQIVSYTDLLRLIDGSGRIIFFVCGNTSFVSSLFSRISSIAYLLSLPIHRGCFKSVFPVGWFLLTVLVKFPFVSQWNGCSACIAARKMIQYLCEIGCIILRECNLCETVLCWSREPFSFINQECLYKISFTPLFDVSTDFISRLFLIIPKFTTHK